MGGDLIGTTRWTGVSLQRLLARVGRDPRATHLRITSADAFFETVALELIDRDPRVMLTYAWDGVPLFLEHGFPLRLYVPGVYGMKQPKVDHRDRSRRSLRTGLLGIARLGSRRADEGGVGDRYGRAGAKRRPAPGGTVMVGGIAHAGARLVNSVEVQVDDGVWQEAACEEPLSSTTWVVWRAEVP